MLSVVNSEYQNSHEYSANGERITVNGECGNGFQPVEDKEYRIKNSGVRSMKNVGALGIASGYCILNTFVL